MKSMDTASTGITGLDEVLCGGLPRDRIYLIQGDPGVGKTTLALQFLLAGVADGERCLYVTLSETAAEIRGVAASHGWSLEGLELVELSAIEQTADLQSDNTLFETAEVELHETTRTLLAHVDRIKPTRAAFDSLSELRLLAQSPLRYRRQILGLKQYFTDKHCTVLMLDDGTSDSSDLQLQSLAHGVVSLEQAAPNYGEDRRRMRVVKLRGKRFRGGYHDLAMTTGGVVIFPRLVAADHNTPFVRSQISSGISALDQQLGGGLDRGTATLITGPAGSGKSALAIQYAVAAAERGDHAVIFTFDERVATLRERSRALGTTLEAQLEAGRLVVQQIDPAEMSTGEFIHIVMRAVEEARAKVIVIDSLNGYLHAMPDERLLTVQLHELLSYLGHRGVTTILVMVQHGMFGRMETEVDVSYVADSVVLTRYFEAAGRIHKAISVVKKRSGAHENTIRELSLGANGITVGEPLIHFTGVLTGVPRFAGDEEELRGSQ